MSHVLVSSEESRCFVVLWAQFCGLECLELGIEHFGLEWSFLTRYEWCFFGGSLSQSSTDEKRRFLVGKRVKGFFFIAFVPKEVAASDFPHFESGFFKSLLALLESAQYKVGCFKDD